MKIYDCWSSLKGGYNDVFDVVSKKNYPCFTILTGLYSPRAAHILDKFLHWFSSNSSYYSAAALWSTLDKSCIIDKFDSGFIRRNSNGELMFKLAITNWDKDVIYDYQCNAFILNAAWSYFKLPTQLFINNVTQKEATSLWYALRNETDTDDIEGYEKLVGRVFNPFLEITFKDIDSEFEKYRSDELSYYSASKIAREHCLWGLVEEIHTDNAPKCYTAYQKILEAE